MRLDEVVRALNSPGPEGDPAPRIDPRPTIFLCPGLDGDEPRLAGFRAELSDRIRFVLIEYPDWPEMVATGQSFDWIVEAAAASIVGIQGSGAVRIAGYSFGGDVGFAVASRLIAMGREVAFLGILDTDLYHVAADAEAFEREHKVRDHSVRDVANEGSRTALGFLLAKCARDVVGLERALRHQRLWRWALSGPTSFAFHRRIRTISRLHAQWRWHRGVQPAPIEVPTVLFRSAAHAAGSPSDLNWLDRCLNLSIVRVEGDHRTMLDPPHRHALCTCFAVAVQQRTSLGVAATLVTTGGGV
jgi:thioesterase domain-containing protein